MRVFHLHDTCICAYTYVYVCASVPVPPDTHPHNRTHVRIVIVACWRLAQRRGRSFLKEFPGEEKARPMNRLCQSVPPRPEEACFSTALYCSVVAIITVSPGLFN